jgi:hypothetical protein
LVVSWSCQQPFPHHVWYGNALPHILQTVPVAPCTVTICHTYFNPRALFQLHKHVLCHSVMRYQLSLLGGVLSRA